jgi:hypothetical protein
LYERLNFIAALKKRCRSVPDAVQATSDRSVENPRGISQTELLRSIAGSFSYGLVLLAHSYRSEVRRLPALFCMHLANG